MQDPRFPLTRQENRIVSRLLAGAGTKEICGEFKFGEETLKRHLTNIFDKTGRTGRVELVLLLHDYDLELLRSFIAELRAALLEAGASVPATKLIAEPWELECPVCKAAINRRCTVPSRRRAHYAIETHFHDERVEAARRSQRLLELLEA